MACKCISEILIIGWNFVNPSSGVNKLNTTTWNLGITIQGVSHWNEQSKLALTDGQIEISISYLKWPIQEVVSFSFYQTVFKKVSLNSLRRKGAKIQHDISWFYQKIIWKLVDKNQMSLPPEDLKLKISICPSVRANLLCSFQCETPFCNY